MTAIHIYFSPLNPNSTSNQTPRSTEGDTLATIIGVVIGLGVHGNTIHHWFVGRRVCCVMCEVCEKQSERQTPGTTVQGTLSNRI